MPRNPLGKGGFMVPGVLAGLKGELTTPLMVRLSVAVPVNRAPMLTALPLGDGVYAGDPCGIVVREYRIMQRGQRRVTLIGRTARPFTARAS